MSEHLDLALQAHGGLEHWREAQSLDVSPRIGHIHVTVDDAPWRWADASGKPLIINCLPPGPHKVLIELVNANHQTLDKGVVTFVIPEVVAPNCRR